MVIKIRTTDDEPPFDDTFSGDDLPSIPRDVLRRHGADVLLPTASTRATVYRTDYLLVPPETREGERGRAVREFLAELDVSLEPDSDPGLDSSIVGPSMRCKPVLTSAGAPSVDVPEIVRRIREAGNDPTSPVRQADAREYTLEHLMFATANFGGAPWDSHNLPGGGSYSRSGGGGPVPVSVVLAPPTRRAVGTDPGQLERRPVIAVLDTGIAPHPWFGIKARGEAPTGNLITVLSDLQAQVGIATLDDQPSEPELPDSWDGPITRRPLTGEIDRAVGHSTFIAGLIRQCAPDADILSIRVMHSDGVAYEADVVRALNALADRVAQAQSEDIPELMVDIVSLSMGGYEETETGGEYTGPVKAAIDELNGLGVTVVTSAGNDATTRPFYPAALAGSDLLLAVGALNTNETTAVFSNEGPWVKWWATGAGLVSTYPVDVRGPLGPEFVVKTPGLAGVRLREAMDPDDFRSGFAVWAGTSFSAPQVAAEVANGLIAGAEDNPPLSLTDMSTGASVKRALKAVEWARARAEPLS